MHGVECNTDHQLLRMKLLLGAKRLFHRPSTGNARKYDVSKLQGRSMDDREEITARGVFQSRV